MGGGFLASGRDPSADAASELPADARLAESLFDSTPDIVFFAKDRQGRYAAVNWALVRRAGRRSKREVLGCTPDEVYPPPLGAAFREQDRRVLEGGAEIRDRLELHCGRDGRPGWCLTYRLPLRDAAGRVVGLMGLSQDLPPPERGDDVYGQVARAVEHLQRHYAEPLRVEKLARVASLSPARFARLIRRLYHVSPGQLLAKTRLDAAMRLLAETSAGIDRVAAACGYRNHSAFTRQFKALVGLSPSEFRAEARRSRATTNGEQEKAAPPVRCAEPDVPALIPAKAVARPGQRA